MIGNAGSVIVFRVGAEDAPLLAAELGVPNPTALTDIANFTAWSKVMQNDLPIEAHHIQMLPAQNTVAARLTAIRNRTRARHARPREAVENRIARFLAAH